MRVLAAVDTVHTAATLCDYLGDRLGPEDEVVAVTVHQSTDADPDAERDGKEALNVLGVRLVLPAVESREHRGDPATEVLAVADAAGVDEIVLGARAGTPGSTDGVGSTVDAVLDAATRPVVVVPLAGI